MTRDAQRHADAKAAYMRRVEIVKARLRSDFHTWAPEFLNVPKKEFSKNTWHLSSPFRIGDNTTCFCIRSRGPLAGSWKDFVSTETGDALNLIMAKKNFTFKEAVAWAEDRFGLRNLSDAELKTLQRENVKLVARQNVQIERANQKKIRAACHTFSKAVPNIEGTLVDRYLQSRGIDLRALPNRDVRWLRFLPSATYWMDKARPVMPAMIAGMVDGLGVMKAVHLTFLRSDGRGKADVEKAKLMWPSTAGLVIRLNNGADNMTPEEAAQHGVIAPLGLGEGNEDGLSIAMGQPDLRVWAAGSLSNLQNVPDHACISSFIVARDNDWGKPQAAHGFEQGLAHLRSFKKPVVPISSSAGKDFNDQLKGNE
jgi:Toprim domain